MTSAATRPRPGAVLRRRPTSFDHRPGLDGIRGLSVAAVLAFHAEYSWASGGYLGVSAFFTLSGFLITTLLLTEHARTGTVRLGAFWARRVRRLLPAAMVCIVGAVVLVLAVGDEAAASRVRGDALAALAYTANWRSIIDQQSYAELFSGESPLLHLWSLAIEEQFYVVLPLLALWSFRSTDPAKRLGVVAVVLALGSLAATLLVSGADRRYYGTDTRALELLVGVALACAHHRNSRVRGPSVRSMTVVGLLATVVVAFLWVALEQSSSLLHPWGLLLHALAIAAVLIAAIEGPLGRAFGTRPLVALGRISYGVYLYHWPIFTWLDESRTGLDGAGLVAVRLAVTGLAAVVSHRYLEQPIRRAISSRPRLDLRVGLTAVVATAVLVVVVTAIFRPGPTIDFDEARALAADLSAGPAGDPATEPTASPETTTIGAPGSSSTTSSVTAVSAEPADVAVFGDSTALLLVPGLLDWQGAHGGLRLVEGFAALGCGLGRDGSRLQGTRFVDVSPGCSFSEVWPGVLARGRPDAALVQIGMWDLVERRLPGMPGTVVFGDRAYDEYLRREVLAANEVLAAATGRVIWILQPPPVASTRAEGDAVFDRVADFNDALIGWLGSDDRVAFIDLADWLASIGATDRLDLRPDGTHFSTETSVQAAEWLGPAILTATRMGGIVRADGVTSVPEPARTTTGGPR